MLVRTFEMNLLVRRLKRQAPRQWRRMYRALGLQKFRRRASPSTKVVRTRRPNIALSDFAKACQAIVLAMICASGAAHGKRCLKKKQGWDDFCWLGSSSQLGCFRCHETDQVPRVNNVTPAPLKSSISSPLATKHSPAPARAEPSRAATPPIKGSANSAPG